MEEYVYEINELSSIIVDGDVSMSEAVAVTADKGVVFPLPNTSTSKKKATRVLACKTCSYITKSSGNLSRHVRAKHLLIKYNCQVCDRAFKSMYVLRQHTRAVHSGDKLICEICSKGFNYHATLSKHKRVIHEKLFKYTCHFCDQTFVDKGHYHGHINRHINSKPYKCQTCVKTYAFESSLRRHVHSCRARPDKFKCNECQTVFSSKVCLQDHVVGKHGAKDKLCMCGKRFSWRTSFTRHQKTCRVIRQNQ